MQRRRLLPFWLLPTSWHLEPLAYARAEARYLNDGIDLELRLLDLEFASDSPVRQRKWLDIQRAYGRIDECTYACEKAKLELDGLQLALTLTDLQCAYGKLSRYDAAMQKLRLKYPNQGLAYDLEWLAIEHDFDRLSDLEFQKQTATLRNEPWITVINSGFDPSKGLDGVFFEFDWNQQWIDFLKLNGYTGHTNDQIVDGWFLDVCRSQAISDQRAILSD
jgi:hypothetical protein